MKRIWIGITIVAVVLAIIFIITYTKEKSEVIKIGAILPLTGDAAIIGEPTHNAVELMVKEYQKNFAEKNYKLELKVEDTQIRPSEGVSALNKLITVDKVRFVIGPMASSVALAVLAPANKNNVILISPSASSPALSADDYFFRVELSEAQGAKQQAELGMKKLKYKKIACLYVNNDYGRGTFEVFSETFKGNNGKIVFEAGFDEGTTDFRSILTKVKNLRDKPDAIFIVFNTEMVYIIRQMEELRVKIQVYTTPVFENEKFLNELGALADGIIYTYYGEYNPNTPKNKINEFVKKYKKFYNQKPGYYAALGYDATAILLEALLAALPDLSSDSVKKALLRIKYEGVSGSIMFDKNGDPEKPVILKKVKNEKFVIYE